MATLSTVPVSFKPSYTKYCDELDNHSWPYNLVRFELMAQPVLSDSILGGRTLAAIDNVPKTTLRAVEIPLLVVCLGVPFEVPFEQDGLENMTDYNVSEFVFPFLLEVEARFWG